MHNLNRILLSSVNLLRRIIVPHFDRFKAYINLTLIINLPLENLLFFLISSINCYNCRRSAMNILLPSSGFSSFQLDLFAPQRLWWVLPINLVISCLLRRWWCSGDSSLLGIFLSVVTLSTSNISILFQRLVWATNLLVTYLSLIVALGSRLGWFRRSFWRVYSWSRHFFAKLRFGGRIFSTTDLLLIVLIVMKSGQMV